MKKRTVAISIALAAVIAATPAVLGGCAGDHYTDIQFAAQDTSYVVTSQGGSTVAYGNYVYFINGTRGYEDTDGNANVWDEVVKGALYRAELKGEKYTDVDGLTKFRTVADGKGMEFKYTEGKDYFDEDIDVVTVAKIAPKTIGTTGYSDGGIFIYDNYLYFATPNNEKNTTGDVQYTRTDYFMMPLSGGKPTKIYTSSEDVDTTAAAYAFYKYGDYVYLVVNEDGTIVTVKVNPAKEDVDDPVAYEVDATSVYFPVRDTYYNGISTDTPEDFIYFVRDVKDGESQRSGSIIEAMRPDGSENFVVSMSGQTETVEAVRDGMVFYRSEEVKNKVLKYTNLHDMLMVYSPSYKAAQDKLSATDKTKQINGTFPKNIDNSITSTYAFRADKLSNTVYFVGVTSSSLVLYQNDESRPLIDTLCSTTGTPLFIQNNYLYFSGSSSNFYRVPLFSNMEGYGTATQIASETTSAGISCDYAAGYFTYFGKVDEWANGYTMFAKVDGLQTIVDGVAEFSAQFVGLRASADIPTDKQIEEAKGTTA